MKYPPGALRALQHLTRDWSPPSRAGFNATGAWSATVQGLAEQRFVGGKPQYRITALGEAVKQGDAQ